MKIIDTAVLIAYINRLDPLCERATRHIMNVSRSTDVLVPSASLIELDLELKTHSFDDEQRQAVYSKLLRLIPSEGVIPVTLAVLKRAAELAPKAKWRGAYFDTLIVATGLEYGAEAAITTDHRFTKIGLNTMF